jgi:hypothetical protein
VPLALAALVVAALLPAAPGGRRARARSAALVLVPLALVTLPQVAVNHLHHGGWSPTPAESRESSLTVLTQGLEIQKHETYVGPPDVYPQGVVHYYDPMTRDVLDDDDLPLRSYRHYVDVLLEHPFEMGTSYARHVFNGLDVRYATPYIRNLEHRPLILPIFAFTLLFVAATQLASSEARRRLGGVRWLGVAILVASILIAIPSPTTPRYFLGVHLLAYLIVCFSPALAAPLLRGGVVRTAGIALAYAGVLVVALTLSADTLRHTEFPLGEDAVSEAAALRVLPNR